MLYIIYPPKVSSVVFGSNKFSKTKFYLNGLPLTYSNNIKYLGIEFNNNLDFSYFFIYKFKAVSNSFFSLNSFGFKHGGINPFLQQSLYINRIVKKVIQQIEDNDEQDDKINENKELENEVNLSNYFSDLDEVT
jgi:hypothetical protein